MAKKKSMTVEEALQVILASEGDNSLRMMLEYMVVFRQAEFPVVIK